MTSFLDRRLHFITGKGGVGKSTLCVLLAQLASSQGKKVLLVELDPDGPLNSFFNAPKLSFTPSSLAPNIDGILVTSRLSLKEYIVRQVKFEKLYDLIFDNQIFNFFLDAAPGIEEIALIGKIVYLEQEKTKNMFKWDMIIVDTPATGHGLYFFKSPKIFLDISKVGPIAKRSREIYEKLLDHDISCIHLVSLAEELPIQETIELHQEIKKLTLPLGKIFLNKLLPSFDDLKESNISIQALSDAIHRFKIRAQIQEQHKKILETTLSIPSVSIPWILNEEPSLKNLKAIARDLTLRDMGL